LRIDCEAPTPRAGRANRRDTDAALGDLTTGRQADTTLSYLRIDCEAPTPRAGRANRRDTDAALGYYRNAGPKGDNQVLAARWKGGCCRQEKGKTEPKHFLKTP
jgi:hypothetical protein